MIIFRTHNKKQKMMEIDHPNTPLEFNDIVMSTTNGNRDESIRSPLSDVNKTDMVTSDMELLPDLSAGCSLKVDDLIESDLTTIDCNSAETDVDGSNILQTSLLTSAVDLNVVAIDKANDVNISPELEDELLADDGDNSAKVADKLLRDVEPVTVLNNAAQLNETAVEEEEGILSTSQRTRSTNANISRNAGDDLDTLLSKINDIVEDCVDARATLDNKSSFPVVLTEDMKGLSMEKNFVDAGKMSEPKILESQSFELAVHDLANTMKQTDSKKSLILSNVAETVGDLLLKERKCKVSVKENRNIGRQDEKEKNKRDIEEVVVINEDTILMVGRSSDIRRSQGNEIEQVRNVSFSKDTILNREHPPCLAKVLRNIDSLEKVDASKNVMGKTSERVGDVSSEVEIVSQKAKYNVEKLNDSSEKVGNNLEKATCSSQNGEYFIKRIMDTLKQAEGSSEKTNISKMEDVSIRNVEECYPSTSKQNGIRENKEAIIERKESRIDIVKTNQFSPPSKSINVDIDDSDDDIVFLVDDVSEKTRIVNEDYAEKKKTEKTEYINSISTMKEIDDDVVLLNEDDDVEIILKTENPQVSETRSEVQTKSSQCKTGVSEEAEEKAELQSDDIAKKKEERKKHDLKFTSSPNCENEIENRNQQENVNVETIEEVEHVPNTKTAFNDEKEIINYDRILDENRNNHDSSDATSENACISVENSSRSQDKDEGASNTESGTTAKSIDLEEETNSNCSSSSNLLQESKIIGSNMMAEGGGDETDAGNDDEEDGMDSEVVTEVEILEGEAEDDDLMKHENNEETDFPPAKRIKLYNDDDDNKDSEAGNEKKLRVESYEVDKFVESSVSLELEQVKVDGGKIETDKNASKRRCLLEESDKSVEKKSKIESSSLTEEYEDQKKDSQPSAELENKDVIIEMKDCKDDIDWKHQPSPVNLEENKEVAVKSPSVKAIPSDKPVPLYPPPSIETITPELSLDFLRRFKKSLRKMTKVDLEELVLQKIVEVIIHKSEFGEMREMLEKQENFIALQRTKLSELSKQFRDLEMVHNRVLRDIETKNSQFLMPVKITRAVGLQVFIPPKKNSDPIANAAANTITSSCGLQPQTLSYRPCTNPSVPPQKQINQYDTWIGAPNTQINSRPSASIITPSSSPASIVNSRRGCVQKVTPQRPVDGASVAPITPPSGIYRNVNVHTQSPVSAQNPAKLLNKSGSVTASQPRARSSSNSGVAQQHQPQQQIFRQQPSPTNHMRKVTPGSGPVGSKAPVSNIVGQQYRRSEPPSTMQPPKSVGSGSPSDAYMSSVHPLQQPDLSGISITPAKPKDKSVIDLTDEDEVPSLAKTQASVRQKFSNSLSVGGSGISSSNYILNKLSNPGRLVSTTSNANAKVSSGRQQLSGLYGSRTNGNSPMLTNIPTPQGTSIIRITPNTSVQRVKYGHPAPLPPTPTQNLHPAWKLPPPRPTIRISNLENGIVISWTVEEPMDRHAECVSYQIYAYQETSGPPLIDSWRHVGDVKAMLLPMAVTLTQFQEGQRYFFAVRAVDIHHRVGPFSVPKTWS